MADLNKIERDIKKLETGIEEAKIKLAESRGQLKILMSQLKETHGFNSVGEAETELDTIVQEMEKVGIDIEGEYEALNGETPEIGD